MFSSSPVVGNLRSSSTQQRYDEIQEKLVFERLLREADLDRTILLQVLNERQINGLDKLNTAQALQTIVTMTRQRMHERNASKKGAEAEADKEGYENEHETGVEDKKSRRQVATFAHTNTDRSPSRQHDIALQLIYLL
ncbi:hypothetical protein RFI_04524 [Reticulomyxa filosa]|uniref:Uncharacterized protein n=1 Tax=Reticulomyxa filosa TaxID=46433 RepID=X6P2X8_RETFI|nr:hypothetical protein RFI_04524 [Reticulomyxa filosa]|eukprot:ETO32591.1 hypothetical protein RFI_04524 [Reticulomyxa filosa]